MRSDFNKLLTERERFGSSNKYREIRRSKKFDNIDNEFGGRRPMKDRYNAYYGQSRKEFNENLNPLKGYLRTRVGKPWNDTYSEIRTNFDARKVINNHILEHLFQYVEIDVIIVDGKPCFPYPYNGNAYRDVREGYSDYFVDPRDGLLKATNADLHRKRAREERKASEAAELKKKRIDISEDSSLFLIHGVWMLFTLADIPAREPILTMWNIHGPKDLMNTSTWISPDVHDHKERDALVKQGRPYYMNPPPGKYWAKKETASRKMLVQHGIV